MLLQIGWHRVSNTRRTRECQLGETKTTRQIWRTSHFRVSGWIRFRFGLVIRLERRRRRCSYRACTCPRDICTSAITYSPSKAKGHRPKIKRKSCSSRASDRPFSADPKIFVCLEILLTVFVLRQIQWISTSGRSRQATQQIRPVQKTDGERGQEVEALRCEDAALVAGHPRRQPALDIVHAVQKPRRHSGVHQ